MKDAIFAIYNEPIPAIIYLQMMQNSKQNSHSSLSNSGAAFVPMTHATL